MLPDHTLSSASIFAGFLVPDRVNDLIDYEWGGTDLQDASSGLQVKIWTCFYQDGWIGITDNAGITHQLLEVAHVTQLSFAFSFSMRPYVTYVANGIAYLWWYDTTISAYVTTAYDAEHLTPQLALDDHRAEQSANADVILLGPQVKYEAGRLSALAAPHGKAVAVIDMADYGMMRGAAVLDKALSLLNH